MADDSPNGSEPSGQTEFQRFESFAKRLVKVPKAEIDKARHKNDTKRRKARSS